MQNNEEYTVVDIQAKVPKVVDVIIPIAQGLRGGKGDKGDPFRYEDFTAEQLESLKGPKGDDGIGLDVAQLTNALKGIGLMPTGSDVYQLIIEALIDVPTDSEDFTVELYLPNEEKICTFTVRVPQAPKYTAPNMPNGLTMISEYTDKNNVKWAVYDEEDDLTGTHHQLAYCDISNVYNNTNFNTLSVQNAPNLYRIVMYATQPVVVWTDSEIKAPAGATLEYHNKELITINKSVDDL